MPCHAPTCVPARLTGRQLPCDADGREQVGRPVVGIDVDQARGAGARPLGDDRTRQVVHDELGQEQQPVGPIELVPAVGGELEDRVERLDLHAVVAYSSAHRWPSSVVP